ncbi:MAG: J domain-containing protein [Candidatus Limnocylindrales bacterium]
MFGTSDHYAVLQVDPRADGDVIQAAYRTLARKYHPDVPGGSHERMLAINDAWTVLRNPDTRAEYDRTRGRGAEAPPAPARPPEAWERSAAATPPGTPSGSVLDFGRYAGWSLGQIARHDPDFLEWFARTPIGRRYQAEIEALLRSPGRLATAVVPGRRYGRFRR